VIKVEQPEHYPDMQATAAGLDAGDLPTGVVSASLVIDEPESARDSAVTAVKSDADKLRLAELVRREFAFIWRLLRRLGLPEADADDAAQQVFLVASRRIDAIQLGSERSFLFGTALRVASRVRKVRADNAQAHVEILDSHPDAGVNLDEMLDQRRARSLLDSILNTMPDEIRVVFVLYEIEELTMAQIATGLEIPAGTVASRLRRAREVFSRHAERLQNSMKRGRSQERTHE
jgi:RNA polymerase sigma-70 factor (ECF subfamily)